MKKIILLVGGIILVLFVGLLIVRSLSGEDGWICVNGEWVKHGNPSADHPNKDCKLLDGLSQKNGEKIQENLIPYGDAILLQTPVENQLVQSPLKVAGKVLAGWTFEAAFRLSLLDARGRVIASAPGLAPDWTDGGFVPFDCTIEFSSPVTETGVLRLLNDNASGLPENDKWVDVPVRFAPAESMFIKVFLNKAEENKGVEDCQKVYPVERMVVKTEGVGKAAINELLEEVLPSEEKDGYFSSINKGVKLQSLKIVDGTAYADFDEMLGWQVGGSCRTAAIRAQITDTLKQFPTVKDVVISIDGRTEDILQP
jgi:hypothetical protein